MTNYEKIMSTDGAYSFAELFNIPTDIEGVAEFISIHLVFCVTCPFKHTYCKKEKEFNCTEVAKEWLEDEYSIDKIRALINS